jgi:predicted DNA-binding WGR domain protein
MTNNKYPEFPDWEKFNKEAKKVSSKFKKEEAEKDRLKMEKERERKEYNLRHGIEEEKPYEFPKKKKKKSPLLY